MIPFLWEQIFILDLFEIGILATTVCGPDVPRENEDPEGPDGPVEPDGPVPGGDIDVPRLTLEDPLAPDTPIDPVNPADPVNPVVPVIPDDPV